MHPYLTSHSNPCYQHPTLITNPVITPLIHPPHTPNTPSTPLPPLTPPPHPFQTAFMALINLVWSCVSGDEDEDDMLPGGRDSRYKSVARVRSIREGEAAISANEKRQYRPLHDNNDR